MESSWRWTRSMPWAATSAARWNWSSRTTGPTPNRAARCRRSCWQRRSLPPLAFATAAWRSRPSTCSRTPKPAHRALRHGHCHHGQIPRARQLHLPRARARRDPGAVHRGRHRQTRLGQGRHFADKTGYGEGGYNDMVAALATKNLKPVYAGRFDLGVKDLTAELTAARAAGPT